MINRVSRFTSALPIRNNFHRMNRICESYKQFTKPPEFTQVKSLTIAGVLSVPVFNSTWWEGVKHTPVGTMHQLPLRKIPKEGSPFILLHYYESRWMNWISLFWWWISGGIICAFVHAVVGVLSIPFYTPYSASHLHLASICLYPFDKDLLEISEKKIGFQSNTPYFTLPGLRILPFISHIAMGILNYSSIIGIVFAEQHFRLAFISLHPNSKKLIDCRKQ